MNEIDELREILEQLSWLELHSLLWKARIKLIRHFFKSQLGLFYRLWRLYIPAPIRLVWKIAAGTIVSGFILPDEYRFWFAPVLGTLLALAVFRPGLPPPRDNHPNTRPVLPPPR